MSTRYLHYHQPQLRWTVDFAAQLDKTFQTMHSTFGHTRDLPDQSLGWQ